MNEGDYSFFLNPDPLDDYRQEQLAKRHSFSDIIYSNHNFDIGDTFQKEPFNDIERMMNQTQ